MSDRSDAGSASVEVPAAAEVTSEEGVLDAEDEASYRDMSRQIDQAVELNPRFVEDVADVIRREVESGVRRESVRTVVRRIQPYLNSDALAILSWIASDSSDDFDRLREFERLASPQASAFVRQLMLHAREELAGIMLTATKSPHDWRTSHRETYYDIVSDRYVVQLTLWKNNGEELFFELSASSLMNLVATLMRGIGAIGTAAAFDEDVLHDFFDQVQEIVNMVTGGEAVGEPAAAQPATRPHGETDQPDQS